MELSGAEDGKGPYLRIDDGRDRDGGGVGGRHGDRGKILTLFELAEEETRLTAEKSRNRKRKRGDEADGDGDGVTAPPAAENTLYTIVATVDAVSPIIAAQTSDPFALLELYDCGGSGDEGTATEGSPPSPPLTAVAVLRGRSALSYHPAIQPGDELVLMGARRRRWHVPRSFRGTRKRAGAPERLVGRAPTHVLVVDETSTVRWAGRDGSSNDNKNGNRDGKGSVGGGSAAAAETMTALAPPRDEGGEGREDDYYVPPPLPSTVVPLTSVQGIVTSVRWRTIGGVTPDSSRGGGVI